MLLYGLRSDALCPDKLPIGIQQDGIEHVFLYLVTSPVPMDFRLFVLRHSELLRPLLRWTIRVLVPEPFARASRQFGHAAREELATPIPLSSVDELQWFFRERQRRDQEVSDTADERFRTAVSMFRAPRFRALYRFWRKEARMNTHAVRVDFAMGARSTSGVTTDCAKSVAAAATSG